MVWLKRIKRKYFVASSALMLSLLLLLVLYPYSELHFTDQFTLLRDNQNLPNNQKDEKTATEFVVFLKTHKAASSTVQNILLRRAVMNNLYVMLNKTGTHLNEFGTEIRQRDLVRLPPGTHFNILCNHIVFNKEEIARFFPKPTIYISIIRDPFQQFVSAFFYYGLEIKRYGVQKCIRRYPKDPVLGYLRHEEKCKSGDGKKSMVDNRMSQDLGFPLEKLKSARKNFKLVTNFLQYVEANFDFIMLVEYFDESIVMLRRLLNWDFEDMIYMKINEMKHANISNFNHDYNETHWSLFRKKAVVDISLYSYFKDKFLKKLRSQPLDFYEELSVFKETRSAVNNFCMGVRMTSTPPPLVISKNKWSDGFNVTEKTCYYLRINETELTKRVRRLQNQRIWSLVDSSTTPHKDFTETN